MTLATLVAEIVELTADDEAPDEHDLAVRHELPVKTVRTTIANLVAAATFHTMPALYWCMVDGRLVPASAHVRGPAGPGVPGLQRRTIEDGHDAAPLARPSTPPLPAPVDGAAALVACPDDPAGEGWDRPLGTPVTSRSGPRTDEDGES